MDGYGDDAAPVEACGRPDGFISVPAMRRADEAVNPEGTEVCNGVDDNCDGDTDGADAIDPRTWFSDSDGDGFGNPDTQPMRVTSAGFVTNALDCDDFNPLVSPFGIEMCDGLDNDCNGETDEDEAIDAGEWFRDMDGDGFGSASSTTSMRTPAVISTTMMTATTGARQ